MNSTIHRGTTCYAVENYLKRLMMINVYSANSTIEAHLIKNLLEQNGIEAYVSGHYLQGGIGELPVFDLIQVQVAEQDRAAALNIIRDYEAGTFTIDEDA